MNGQLSRRALLGAGAAGLVSSSLDDVLAQGLGPLLPRPTAGMPDFAGAVEWMASPPLRMQELRGKVVLVQFWTFTCVNWLRTLPFVKAWSTRYRDAGLVVVGVHTPEFSFEHDVANVREMRDRLGIGYPVAVDSELAVWTSFGNNAWPALYLFDAQGKVRYQHDGEGAYDTAESWIQRLLAEAGAKDVPAGRVQVDAPGSQAPADWANLRSPETYTGYAKADRFRSPGGIVQDRKRTYERPARLPGNAWALAGDWTIGPEVARSETPRARLVVRFHARDVNLVMGAARRDRPVPYRVLLDGETPGAAHGSDIDAGGRGVLVERRLHQLVRQPGAIRDREVEIEFLEPGTEVYALTFG